MAIQVRKATITDYEPLCVLFEEIDAYHRDHLPHLFKKPGGPSREHEYFAGLLADENVGFFVAEAGHQLVGFVYALVRDTPDIPIFVPRRFATVDTIVVASPFRRLGIGRQLMDTMQAWAIAKGAVSIELTVYEFNQTAISFYEQLCYQPLHRRMSKELKVDEAAG